MLPMLILLGGAAFVLLLSLYATERLLVQPRPPVRPSPAGCDIVYEDVSFTTRDGVGLRGWFFASVGRPVIIYCPGRGEGLNAFDFRYAPLFYHGGYQVLMFDWRGMGASGGQSSMAYWEKLDLQAAVRYVRERGISGTIGAMGTSLGAAVIFLAAGEIPDLAAVAGESAFATYEGMIASGLHALYAIPSRITRILAWVIARFAAWRGRFPLHDADPVRAIGRISPRPVFVIHGKNDRHVPVQAGLALYEAAGEPKTIWLPDVAHTEGLQILGPEYASRLLAFFDRWLK